MANEDREFFFEIEDYSLATLTDVIPDQQFRMFNKVTGYQAGELIWLKGDGSTQLQNLPKNQWNIETAQTFFGVKTYDSIPILPASDPTTDNQAARKRYVDNALGLPPGYIFGLETETAADADHDVTINTGRCRSSDNTTDIILGSALTKKIDAPFAEGNNQGGIFTGTVAANTTYHLFAISKDDGTVDAGWDTALNPTANLPTDYTKYRHIRSHMTDGSSNIINTIQHGDKFIYVDPQDVSFSTFPTSRTNVSLPVPQGIEVEAEISVSVNDGVGNFYVITNLSQSDIVPSSSRNDGEGNVSFNRTERLFRLTDTSGRVGIRFNASSGATYRLFYVSSYIHRR